MQIRTFTMPLLCLLILNINAQVFTSVTEDGGPGMGIDDFEVEPIFPGNDPDLLYFYNSRIQWQLTRGIKIVNGCSRY
jgi:hypothetical protein